MMIFSHRGNLDGPNPDIENDPGQIEKAISKGFSVEVDVWVKPKDNTVWIGHDFPKYQVDKDYIIKNQFDCIYHAKNFEALSFLNRTETHFFWHENDKYTMTSHGIIWMYPLSNEPYNNTDTIMAVPELAGFNNREDLPNIYGVCTDYVYNWQ
jgi:hypothetical protein